jgi:hypothetical protein
MSEPHPKFDRLKQVLLENGETPETADDLAQMAFFLDKLPAPQARAAHQQALLHLLKTDLPAQKSRWQRLTEWYPLAVLISQIRIIHREIWAASALVLALGVAITLALPSSAHTAFAVLAPIVAAAGVALLYDGEVMQMLELENSTRTSARVLLLARLTLIFGFDLVLALLGSAILAVLSAEISFMPLVAAWLAPMTFLSGLAFLLSVLLVDTLAASAFSLALWLLHVLFRDAATQHLIFQILSLPGFAAPHNRLLLMLLGVVLVGVGLWSVGIIERQSGEKYYG